LRKDDRKLGRKFLVGYCSLFDFFTFLVLPSLVNFGLCMVLSSEEESSLEKCEVSSDLFLGLMAMLVAG
jgi:hypothetical protein